MSSHRYRELLRVGYSIATSPKDGCFQRIFAAILYYSYRDKDGHLEAFAS